MEAVVLLLPLLAHGLLRLARVSCCLRDSFHSLWTRLSRGKQADLEEGSHPPPLPAYPTPCRPPHLQREAVVQISIFHLQRGSSHVHIAAGGEPVYAPLKPFAMSPSCGQILSLQRLGILSVFLFVFFCISVDPKSTKED